MDDLIKGITFEEDLYFKSEAERYMFALLEMDGSARADILGITRAHYRYKEIADQWRNHIFTIISRNPDHPMYYNACNKLDYFYNSMTQEYDECELDEDEYDSYEEYLVEQDLEKLNKNIYKRG